MAGDISRLNGKKGGRPKGLASISAEQARIKLAQMVQDEIVPLGLKLIKEGKKGNIQAIKELFDRAFGKAPQAITGQDGGPLKIMFDQAFNQDDTPQQTT